MVTSNECITADLSREEVRQEPFSLPAGFQWDTLHLDDPLVLKELYVLLNENYVEDDDNMFRFDYSPEFLAWALKPPGFLKEWHCGVRVSKSNKLVGFISAVPAHIRIYEKTKQIVEINFLCVHKKLRAKRLAPVLIKEITRRVNITGIFQVTCEVEIFFITTIKLFAGCLHSRCGAAQASWNVSLLAQIHQPEEADRGEIPSD